MQRAVSSLLIILFLLWILPLGYFIKPEQQKAFCDGQRGMCMCTVFMVKKAPTHSSSQIVMPAPSSSHEASSGGAGNYFEFNSAVLRPIHSAVLPNIEVDLIPASIFILPIDHVPKV